MQYDYGPGGGNDLTAWQVNIAPPALTTDCANPFTDISGNTFYAAIHYLACTNSVSGTDATHFSPASTATRAQFARVVVKAFGLLLPNPPSTSFTDVPNDYFAHNYIESGLWAGILSGYDQATCTQNGAVYPCYLPNRPITRAELTRLVVKAGLYPITTPSSPSFNDVPPSYFAYQYIETAHAKAVINGYPDGTFHPNQPIRRDEMCQIVYKVVITP